MSLNPCPLCESLETKFYEHAMDRVYSRCANCELLFVNKTFLLDKFEEKKRYNLHENSINDLRYIQFLSQITAPLIARLKPKSSGLDFGSGPEPVLAQLFEKKGFTMSVFDPYYANNPNVLNEYYDFITLTEVAEHLYNPSKEFKKLVKLLKTKGYLAILTLRTDSVQDFKNWHYQKDETHVCFFSDKSMKYLAAKHQLSLELLSDRLAIFQKNDLKFKKLIN